MSKYMVLQSPILVPPENTKNVYNKNLCCNILVVCNANKSREGSWNTIHVNYCICYYLILDSSLLVAQPM